MLKDNLHVRQADLLAANFIRTYRAVKHPWLSLRQRLNDRLRRQGLELVKTSARLARPSLGDFYLVRVLARQIVRTHVDLLGLAKELGIKLPRAMPIGPNVDECVVSCGTKEVIA